MVVKIDPSGTDRPFITGFNPASFKPSPDSAAALKWESDRYE
jgi:hypothetical protein